jgi:uncharacterized membrane-anchored protein YjiN (DUF445 family)
MESKKAKTRVDIQRRRLPAHRPNSQADDMRRIIHRLPQFHRHDELYDNHCQQRQHQEATSAMWTRQKAALETDFKAQSSTMDDTVAKVLNRMDAIDLRIDTKMTSMQTSLQAMIDAKLDVPSHVMQVAAAIGGEASPFVTAASLKITMKGFIEQINGRIDNLAPVSTGKPSKREKSLQENPIPSKMTWRKTPPILQPRLSR